MYCKNITNYYKLTDTTAKAIHQQNMLYSKIDCLQLCNSLNVEGEVGDAGCSEFHVSDIVSHLSSLCTNLLNKQTKQLLKTLNILI